MREVDPFSEQNDAPVIPWRLVAGAFLHFVVPIYLVAVAVDAVVSAPRDATIEAILHGALPFSGWFLASYLLLALFATASAAAIDLVLRARRARRVSSNPLAGRQMSERRLAAALMQGRGKFGAEADAHLAAIRAMRWDHADHRFQTMSNDLQDVISTASAALVEALPDRRPALIRMACDSLVRIKAALDDLVAERRHRAEGDAEAVFRYVEVRHGGSDFSGSAD